MAPNSTLTFHVHWHESVLVAPFQRTPLEVKCLSDIDDQDGLRLHVPVIQFYRYNPSMIGVDPAKVIRDALAKALVPYYLLAGRLRELQDESRKLVVECTGEGVLFIEADAEVSLQQFGDLMRPLTCLNKLLFDVPGSSNILNSPLLLIQERRLFQYYNYNMNALTVNEHTPPSTNVGDSMKSKFSDKCGSSLGSGAIHELSALSPADSILNQKDDILRLFLPARCTSLAVLAELQLSVYATIERCTETYVCIHDLVEFVSKKVRQVSNQIKWRHVNDRTFLFVFPDKAIKAKFADTTKKAGIGDAVIKFEPWRPTISTVKKPCRFKVWLKLSGLPVELFTFATAEIVVTSFGRLHRCNMEKKKVLIGDFFIMIDCPDIDDIRPRVMLHAETDGEIPIFIDKMYACSLEAYNSQHFDDNCSPFDDIITKLIACGKLVAIK